jgi:hypothetical protein
MRPCFFEVWVGGKVVSTNTLEGLSCLEYESARRIDRSTARWLRVYTMRDPVLDGVEEYDYDTGGWNRVGGPRISSPNECQFRERTEIIRRPANALNIEIGAPADRCLMRPPGGWREGRSNMAWLLSGGSVLSYGLCCGECPAEALMTRN